MEEFIVIGGIIISISLVIRYFFKKKKGDRREYSLGLKAAQEVQVLIKNKDYNAAEKKVENQKLNDITQIIDHLSLSLKEDELLKWEELKKNDLSKLTLGVFYLHLAWITRSHKLAKNISQKQTQGFYDYLQLCETFFESISTDSFYGPEVMSRKIRLYMSLGNDFLATQYFNKLSENQPSFIWPYIHYSELIQPKWGGTIKDLEDFYQNLPSDFLIHSIVELKLILDSTIMSDNYFRKYCKDINEFAREKVLKIDSQFNFNQVNSIHKYILFNYMAVLSQDLGIRDLKEKYEKLMDNNYTIYPYGLLK